MGKYALLNVISRAFTPKTTKGQECVCSNKLLEIGYRNLKDQNNVLHLENNKLNGKLVKITERLNFILKMQNSEVLYDKTPLEMLVEVNTIIQEIIRRDKNGL